MNFRSHAAFKLAYLVILLVFALAFLGLVERAVDVQVEALPYYAQIWG